MTVAPPAGISRTSTSGAAIAAAAAKAGPGRLTKPARRETGIGRERAPVDRDRDARPQQGERLGGAAGVQVARRRARAPAPHGQQGHVDAGAMSAIPSNRSVSPAK